MKYLLSIVLAAVVIAAGSCSRPNGPADGENSSVVSYASTSDTTAVQSETVNQTESSITVDSSTTTTNSGGNAMTTTTARTTTTTPKQSMSTTAGANPTESKTFELYLEQYHPGIPGFDARYTLRAEYDGLPVRAADIQYSCSLSDVRIDNNQVTIPESVRNQGQAVTITGKHINGAVRELSIPMRQWKIAFEDDFEGDALDTSKWAPFEVGVDYGGDSVTVEDCYEIGDGVLSLKVNNEPVTIGGKTFSLTSAAISTYRAFSLKNGCFLASIKVPKEAGVNSAFWLMPKPISGGDGVIPSIPRVSRI